MEVKFPSWLTSKLCVVEIKTRVNKKTQAAADMIKDSYGSFVECGFLSDDFINMVEADHRIQILHNVAVVGLTDALYVVGTTETITYVVLVHFNDIVLKSYLQMLEKITVRCLQWIKQVSHSFPMWKNSSLMSCHCDCFHIRVPV